MKVLKVLSVAMCTLVLASCATGGGNVASVKQMLKDTTGQNGRACVRTSEITGFGVLKHDVVSIDTLGDGYYLATVLPGCTDLQTSMRAYFKSNFHEVCGGKMDRMVTRDNRCVIHQMFEFKNRDEAFSTYNNALEQRQEQKKAASERPTSDNL